MKTNSVNIVTWALTTCLALFAIMSTSIVSAQSVVNMQKTNTDFSIDGNGGAVPRQQVYLWNTNEDNVNQQWLEIDRGDGFYSYQKNNTGMCLDGGNGGARRQAVILWPCGSSNQNQHWRKVSTNGGTFRLEKRNASGFSIDGDGGAARRQQLYLWDSSNSNVNQQWVFRTTGNTSTSNCPGTFDLPTCMQNMANNGGGTVTLDAKTYQLSTSLRLQSNVNIVGQGKGQTVIRFTDAVENTINEPLMLGIGVNNIEFKDFTLQCSIDQNPNSSDLRNDHMGVFMDGPGDPSIGERTDNNNVRMRRIEARHCSNGMHLKGLTGFTAIDLDLHENGNTETDLFHNIYLRRVADVHVSQTSATSGGLYGSNRGHGLRLSHIRNAYFGNVSVYDNADHGVHMTDGIYDMRFYQLSNEGNCANPSGGCGQFRCYGSPCEIDTNAAKE